MGVIFRVPVLCTHRCLACHFSAPTRTCCLASKRLSPISLTLVFSSKLSVGLRPSAVSRAHNLNGQTERDSQGYRVWPVVQNESIELCNCTPEPAPAVLWLGGAAPLLGVKPVQRQTSTPSGTEGCGVPLSGDPSHSVERYSVETCSGRGRIVLIATDSVSVHVSMFLRRATTRHYDRVQ